MESFIWFGYGEGGRQPGLENSSGKYILANKFHYLEPPREIAQDKCLGSSLQVSLK